jgi:HEAT repeat protein
VQQQVRGTLVERLARLPGAELRDLLNDDDSEIRRAAILAAARKKEMALAPDLLALLEHADTAAARQAEEGLELLSGRHFDDPADWKAWWEKANFR